jgi:hypothetical protein
MRWAAEPYRQGVWSSELAVALSPDQTFERLITNRSPARGLLTRLSILLFTIAIVVPTLAAQRVTASLAATAAVSWGFVLVIQIIVAVGVILSARARRVGLIHALDLWFAGHIPYSLWMVAMAVLAANSHLVDPAFMFVTAVVPAGWTAWIVAAFCRTVLNVDRTGARRRAAAHQVVVWGIALTYGALTTGGWFQIVNAARIIR